MRVKFVHRKVCWCNVGGSWRLRCSPSFSTTDSHQSATDLQRHTPRFVRNDDDAPLSKPENGSDGTRKSGFRHMRLRPNARINRAARIHPRLEGRIMMKDTQSPLWLNEL